MEIKSSSQSAYQQAFGTRIKIVSPDLFKFVERRMKSKPLAHINDWNLKLAPNETYAQRAPYDSYRNISYYTGYCLNQENILTKGIKSCTAGFVIKKGEPAPLAFHVFNSKIQRGRIKNLQPFMHGDNAIIIGGKSVCNYSLSNFDTFKRNITHSRIPLTYMKDMTKHGAVDLAYISSTDTLYMCVKEHHSEKPYVKNLKQLKKIFRKIQISPTDKLEFISSIKAYVEELRLLCTI